MIADLFRRSLPETLVARIRHRHRTEGFAHCPCSIGVGVTKGSNTHYQSGKYGNSYSRSDCDHPISILQHTSICVQNVCVTN